RNIPLAAGTGDETYLRLFEEELVPEIERFRPDVILISAGFDAHAADPVGNMTVSSAGFGEMTRIVAEVAGRVCDNRIVSFLEGGYAMDALTESVELHLRHL
ncbi:MAG: histone deacetylase, partial [Thermoanaerobaculia bacterium]|nr:histone deacetylase [Thermoanaerobaculia bacterium]